MYNKGIQLRTSAKRYSPSGYDTTGSLYKGKMSSALNTRAVLLVTNARLHRRNPLPGQMKDESTHVLSKESEAPPLNTVGDDDDQATDEESDGSPYTSSRNEHSLILSSVIFQCIT